MEDVEHDRDTCSPPHTTRDRNDTGLHLYSTSTYFLHIELIIIAVMLRESTDLTVGQGSLSPLARVSGEAWTEQLSLP